MLLLAIIINFVVAAWIYPELFTQMDLRMVQGHDTCGPMQYVFYLIGQFYQGGVQLFNRYDLMNSSFTELSVGLYTPMNFLIAAGFILLSPFVHHPAQFFHHWYVFSYYGIGLTLRTFGTYVLALYMTKSPFVAIITSVWVNAFCSITMMNLGGQCISLVYSYLPLLLFCLVYYWETRSFKAIVALILVFFLSINNSLYVGIGYTYQTLHLFLLDMLVIWLLFQRGTKPLLAGKFEWRTAGQAICVTLLVFLPVWWWGKNVLNDFVMFGSGLGESQGRFHHLFNPLAIMKDPARYFVSFHDYFNRAYDFTTNAWYLNGTFLGVMTMVLSVVGLVLAKHSFKLLFITAAVMMVFLNVPSNQGHSGWMLWAHWIDTLTDPACFLIRSFHFIVFLWYLTLAIPLCLGLQSCLAIVTKKFQSIHAGRINLLKGALVGMIGASLFIPDLRVRGYVLTILGIFLLFFIIFDNDKFKTSLRMTLAGMLFLTCVGLELSALKTYVNTQSVYMNWSYWDGLRVKPRVFNYMYTSPTPMVLDYQNPRTLPVRFFYRTDKHVVWPLVCEFQGWFGLFYQYMPLALRLERPDSLYVPRMKVFQNIDKDSQIQEYISRDGRVMYLADAAIAPNSKDYAFILNAHLDRRVVQVEAGNADKVQHLSDLRLGQEIPENFKQHDYAFQPAVGTMERKPEGIEYQWALPKEFPRYLSTTLFTPDVFLWHFNIGTRELTPAQGDLVSPWTFDVNNVRDGYVTVLLPQGVDIAKETPGLHVWTSTQLVDVGRNSEDEFGFTYLAPHGGWWVMHLPYDPQWQLYIDGIKTPISKINHYFIGAPLSAGEHKILLSYWPDSPLRPLILISTLAAWGIMFVVFGWTYRWSKL